MTPLPFVEYLSIPAISWSALKGFRDSPEEALWSVMNPTEQTDDMALGTAFHVAALEPAQLPRMIAVWEGGRRAGSDWSSFVAANRGKTIVKADDYEIALEMGRRVKVHPIAGPMVAEGVAEQSIVWVEQVPYGLGTIPVLCRGRLDFRRARCSFVDLKSTRAPRLFPFCGQSEQMGTFHQVAFYRRGIAKIEGVSRDAVSGFVIAVGKKPPYIVAAREPDGDSLESCDVEIDECLRQLVECWHTKVWRGPHEAEVESMRRPRYAMPEDDGIDDLIFGGDEDAR